MAGIRIISASTIQAPSRSGQDEPKRLSLLLQTIFITNSASQTLPFHPSPAVSSLWKAKTTLPIVIFSATITDPCLFVHAIAENTITELVDISSAASRSTTWSATASRYGTSSIHGAKSHVFLHWNGFFSLQLNLQFQYHYTSTLSIHKGGESITQLTPPQMGVFHFTKEKIAQLKAKANADAKTQKISSLQAVLTHLRLSVIRNKRFLT
ncbi:hypothetical protein Ahy_B01g052800 [Arachis hypogaea]|uniref:Uncharacterized protein n=1 Tax=Arachis hypogaea TaxID=3818 RepID=A0A445AQF7_ARAHY|nr:hypothetical protein Ahy_B01g052800 [Arachis hypogaea]